MKSRGLNRIKAKLAARIWMLDAAQRYSGVTDRQTQMEVRRIIRRFQRDIKSLQRAEIEWEKSRKAEIAKLIKSQRADDRDRKLRFENAISK